MRTLYGSAANVQRRTHPLVDAERFGSDRGADNIDHRIDGADLVKMNSLDRSVVNLGFGRAQSLEDANRSRLCLASPIAAFSNNLPNLVQAAAMLMFVRGRLRPRLCSVSVVASLDAA